MDTGMAMKKLTFIPEAHNDFIVSIMFEKLHVVVVAVLLLLFAVLVYRGVRMRRKK